MPRNPPEYRAVMQQPRRSQKPGLGRPCARYPKRGLDRFNILSGILFAAIGGLLSWLATWDTKLAPSSVIPLSFYGWIIGLMQMLWMFLVLFRLHAHPDHYVVIVGLKVFVGLVHFFFAVVNEQEPIQPSWFLLWLAIMAWLDAAAIIAIVKVREVKQISSAAGPAFEKDVV